jgi:recombination protein RecT
MTVSAALEKQQNSPAAIIGTYTQDFALVLPSHFKPETFVRLAQGTLRQNPKLMEAAQNSPGSLLVALLDAARLGHEPGTPDYYLVPRKGKQGLNVQGIEGYRGVIKRMFNSGTVESVVAEAVYKDDHFKWNPGTMRVPDHQPESDRHGSSQGWFGDRGECSGAYAYAIMKGGAISKVAIVGDTRIKRAMRASDGANSEYSPWKNDYEKMVIKTALHDLEPYVPKSADAQIRDAEQQTKAAEAADKIGVDDMVLPPNVDTETGEVIVAELVD